MNADEKAAAEEAQRMRRTHRAFALLASAVQNGIGLTFEWSPAYMNGGIALYASDLVVRAVAVPDSNTKSLPDGKLLAAAVLGGNDLASQCALADMQIEMGLDPSASAYDRGVAKGVEKGRAELMREWESRIAQGLSSPAGRTDATVRSVWMFVSHFLRHPMDVSVQDYFMTPSYLDQRRREEEARWSTPAVFSHDLLAEERDRIIAASFGSPPYVGGGSAVGVVVDAPADLGPIRRGDE